MDICTIGTGSSGNCYSVSDGKTKILIECGLAFKKIKEALGESFLDVNKCLVSHRHSDHAKSIRMTLKHHIDCYMISDVKQHCKFKTDGLGGKIKVIRTEDTFRVGSFEVNSFGLHHSVPIVGFLITSLETKEVLLFATDTTEIADKDYNILKFQGLTHMMVEANYDERILIRNESDGVVNEYQSEITRSSHMELETAVSFIKKQDISNLKEIHLLHLSSKNADAVKFKARFKCEFKDVTVYYNNK